MSKKYDWPQLIADFERSGLRLSQYTRLHGIPYSSMYQQVSKLKRKRGTQSPTIDKATRKQQNILSLKPGQI